MEEKAGEVGSHEGGRENRETSGPAAEQHTLDFSNAAFSFSMASHSSRESSPASSRIFSKGSLSHPLA